MGPLRGPLFFCAIKLHRQKSFKKCPPTPHKKLWWLGATPYSVALKFLPHLFRGRPTISRHAEIPQFVIPLCHTYSMTEKLIEVNNIYAQMAELSDSSLRPHPWVMGFSYGRDGGISIWWDHAYESSQYLLGKLDLVDWFHEGFFIADRMVQLVPLPLISTSLRLFINILFFFSISLFS